jgi:predicted nucleic acid-binding protein
MIVADTSLIASFYLETELTPLAKRIHKKAPIWIFPPLWKEEYANVLAKFARKNTTTTEETVLSHFEYTLGQLEKYERKVDLSAVLRLALRFRISVYDAHFVQLAIDNQIMLVTEDQEIIKKCPEWSMSMENFLHH